MLLCNSARLVCPEIASIFEGVLESFYIGGPVSVMHECDIVHFTPFKTCIVSKG